MNGFFDSPERQATFLQEASSWTGTPFRLKASRKGVGVDCVNLIVEVMRACGVDYSLPTIEYTADWGQHKKDSLFLKFIEQSGLCESVEVPQVGDIVCIRTGKCVNHGGLVVSPVKFLHAWRGHGVLIGRLDDPTYRDRTHSFWRVMA